MLILSYHRVSPVSSDPWGLSVSPAHFGAHMRVLRAEAKPIPLGDVLPLLRSGEVPSRGVAVTFDDGYVDNLIEAKPQLEQAGVPATVFVATGYVESGRAFWWDVLQGLLLDRATLPPILRLEIAGRVHTWTLGEHARFERSEADACRSWRAWQPAPTARHELYLTVWNLLRPLAEAPRLEILERLIAWADDSGRRRNDDHAPTLPPRAVTRTELRALARGGLVALGAHTVTHPLLSLLPPAAQHAEIDGSRQALDEIEGGRVLSFAYPYGDLDATTVGAVRQSGMTLACAGGSGRVDASSDPLRLPRVQVENWSAEEFRGRLTEWLRA